MTQSANEIQFNKELGQIIRTQRKKYGLSLKDIAMRTGVSFQQIQKYEAGTNTMSCYFLHKLSHLFETSFGSYIGSDFSQSDYRILEKNRIQTCMTSVHNALNNLESELLRV